MIGIIIKEENSRETIAKCFEIYKQVFGFVPDDIEDAISGEFYEEVYITFKSLKLSESLSLSDVKSKVKEFSRRIASIREVTQIYSSLRVFSAKDITRIGVVYYSENCKPKGYYDSAIKENLEGSYDSITPYYKERVRNGHLVMFHWKVRKKIDYNRIKGGMAKLLGLGGHGLEIPFEIAKTGDKEFIILGGHRQPLFNIESDVNGDLDKAIKSLNSELKKRGFCLSEETIKEIKGIRGWENGIPSNGVFRKRGRIYE